MKNYSLPQAIIFSFFSAPMYRAIAEQWRARSLIYLFLVLLLCWTPGLVMLHRTVERGFQSIRENTIPKLPTVRIEKGVLKTPEARPYVLDISEGGATGRIVIDTTGKYKTLSDAQAIVLITDKQALVRKSAVETSTYDFSRVKDMSFGPPDASRFLGMTEKWLPAFVYPLIFVLSFVKRFIQAMLIALLGLFMLRWIDSDLSFPALLTLAVVSMTPTLILWTILSAGGAAFPLQWLVMGFVNFTYFLFAINAASDKTIDDDEDA